MVRNESKLKERKIKRKILDELFVEGALTYISAEGIKKNNVMISMSTWILSLF